MNIRTKLRAGTIVTVTFVAIGTCIVAVFLSLVHRANEKQKVVDEITRNIYQSALVREDFVKFPTERPSYQWTQLRDLLKTMLTDNEYLFTTDAEQSLLREIRSLSNDGDALFAKLGPALKEGEDQNLVTQLDNQMSMKSQEKISAALQLGAISRQSLNAMTWTLGAVLSLLSGTLLILSALAMRINEKIARAIKALEHGTTIVADGNLSHRLNAHDRDELGKLANAFNAMASRLQNYYADLEADVREATQEMESRQAELVESNAFLDAIIENIPHMIFLKDADELRFVRFNKAGEKLLGHARNDLIGKNDYDFFPKEQADFFVQKDRKVLEDGVLTDIALEPIDAAAGKRFLHTKKIPIMGHDGEPRYLLGISEDVTEQKKNIEDLQKYRQAVLSSTDGVIMTDPETNIIFVNPAWCKINGYEAHEAIGKRASMLKSNRTPSSVIATLRTAIAAGKSFHSDDLLNQRKDGSTYCAELTLYPITNDSGDTVLHWVGLLADISDRKKSDRAKTEFVSLASHQLRTPIGALRLALRTLLKNLKGPLTEEQKVLLMKAETRAVGMSQTINTLLSVALAEEGNVPLSPEEFCLSGALDAALALHEQEAQRKSIRCTVTCDPMAVITTDKQIFSQILENIVGNAVRYTPQNGSIGVTGKTDKHSVIVEVRDTGIGISKNEQKAIFSKFFRGHNAMKIDTDGAGLGLYLASSFTTLLGGTISVQSAENAGTTFTVTLPHSP